MQDYTVDRAYKTTIMSVSIVKKDIILPDNQSNKVAFGLFNAFTEEECKDYIKLTEEKGYNTALVNTGGNRSDNLRVKFT